MFAVGWAPHIEEELVPLQNKTIPNYMTHKVKNCILHSHVLYYWASEDGTTTLMHVQQTYILCHVRDMRTTDEETHILLRLHCTNTPNSCTNKALTAVLPEN